MAEQTKTSVICVFVIAFAIISSVSSQCCDFFTYPCSWDETSWRMSNGNPPDLTSYPNFVLSQTDPLFMYIEDWPGSTISFSSFSIPNDATVIAFDYFLDSPIAQSADYFQIEFFNSDKSTLTLLSTINAKSSFWQHAQVTCNVDNNYCCGSIDALPCLGQLRIVANVDETFKTALIAIDNIGTTCSDVTTVAPPPTSAPPTTATQSTLTPTSTTPPSEIDCCTFYTDDCGSSGDWVRSSSSSNCFYDSCEVTDVDGAVWVSSIYRNVNSSTQFTINYNIYSDYNYAELALAFKEYESGLIHDIMTLSYYYDWWPSQAFYCSSCCGADAFCDGQLMITATINSNIYVSIDNIYRDNLC